MPDFWAYHSGKNGQQLGITGPHPSRQEAIEAGKAKFPGKALSHGYGNYGAHFDIRHTSKYELARGDSAQGLEAPGTSGERTDADESYWTYRAATPTPERPPPGSPMSMNDWHSLSPGMRREIWRTEPKTQKLDACMSRIDRLCERLDVLDAAMSPEEREAVNRFLATKHVQRIKEGVAGLGPGHFAALRSERESERELERGREAAYLRTFH